MATNDQSITLSPLKITVIYLIVAGIWIAFTDRLLESLVTDAHALSILQTYKGWFYVLLTGAGLYWLIKKHEQQLQTKEIQLENLLGEVQSEKELKDVLFERIPILITIYDPDLETFEVNKEFEKVTGWTNQEIKDGDIDLLKAVYPDLETRKEAAAFMNNPGVGWEEFDVTTKNGEKIPTSWTDIRLTDNTSVGIGIDMTDIKASQAKIRESRELLKKVFESLESSLIILDYESRTIVDCNKSTEDLFGYTKEELEGSSTRMLHISDKRFEEFNEIGKDALAEKGAFQTEFQMQRKDGTIFHSDHTVTLVYDEEGEIDKVVSVIRDITDQKLYEQKLKKRQERLQRSQKIGQIGDWEFNIETEEITWSDTMYEIYERDSELGPPPFEILMEHFHGSSSDNYRQIVQQAIENNHSYDIDIELTTEKENHKYIRTIGIPIRNEKQEVTKLLGIAQDITERKKSEKELQERKYFIEKTIQNLPIGVAVNTIDDGKVTLINNRFTEIYGWPQKTLKKFESFFKKVYPDKEYRKQIFDMINADIASGNPDQMQWKGIRVTTQEGKERIVNAKNIPLYDQNLMISTVVDVTEQKELEHQLRESEEKYRHLFKNNPEPMWIYDPETLEFIEVNEAAINHYGYSEKEFMNMTLLDIRPEEDAETLKENVKQNKGTTAYSEEWVHLTKDGTKIDVELSASDVQYDQGKTYRLVLINDITEQKRIQERIIQSVIEGEDRERKRIAHELHDGLGQYLVAASMNLQSAKTDIEKLNKKRQTQFETGISLLKSALSETRSIAYNLMPKAISDYGLIPALENLINDFRKSTNIKFRFTHNCDQLQLNNQAEINIFRILQETITNAIRHAECTKVDITLHLRNETLTIEIQDNGIGAQLDDQDEQKGLGLRSIKTRVSSLKGSLNIDSDPGKGMQTTITIPQVNNLKSTNTDHG